MAKSNKLVMLNAPLDQVDKLISICLKDDNFEALNASEFISSTMGYEQYNQENPYVDLLQEVTQMIEYGFDITTKVHEIDIIHDKKAQRYLQNVKTKFEKFKEEQNLLQSQLEQCQSAIEKYSHFEKLDLDLGDVLDCKFISMRFGHISFEGYKKLTSIYGENPYIMFKICSEDKNGYWGAYFAPKDKANEIDSIFVVLNFERLYIPGAVGQIGDIIEQVQTNIEIIKDQKSDFDKKFVDILKKESGEIVSLYFALLRLDEIHSYKRYAVKNSKDSFVVGTIPSNYEKKFVEKFENIPNMFINIEKRKITKK